MGKMFLNRIAVFFLVLLFSSVFVAGSARSETVRFPLDLQYTDGGSTPASSSLPWITATFEDSVSDLNTVRLTMSADNLTGSEFISQWYFNFDPVLDASRLSFSAYDISSVPTFDISTDIATGTNSYKAGGDGYFDIMIDLPTSNAKGGDRRFISSEQVILDLTYDSPITASSFSFTSNGERPYHTAAHVQSIGPDGEYSGWIANTSVVPEPVSAFLFIAGGATLGGRHFCKRKNSIN
jgi:hypothetical protein